VGEREVGESDDKPYGGGMKPIPDILLLLLFAVDVNVYHEKGVDNDLEEGFDGLLINDFSDGESDEDVNKECEGDKFENVFSEKIPGEH
jgi:hypothetical protein